MAKKKEALRMCKECIHEYACQAWNVGHISDMDASHCLNYEKSEDSNAYFLGRTKAIEEFAEAICCKVSDDSLKVMLPDGFRADVVTIDFVNEMAIKIAESMKGGK